MIVIAIPIAITIDTNSYNNSVLTATLGAAARTVGAAKTSFF